MTDLVDLDAIAQGSATPIEPWALRAVDEPAPQTGVTILPKTFKAKVKFRWRDEQSGATVWHHATCQVCSMPMWMAMDTLRSRLLVSTSSHKDEHYRRATSNKPASIT